MPPVSKRKASPVELSAQDWGYYFDSQGQRLDSIDAMSQKLQQDMRDLRSSQQSDSQYLNQRIDKVQETLSEKLDQQTDKLAAHFDTGLATVSAAQKATARRLTNLETWRTLIVGGAAVAFLVIGDILVRILYGPVGKYVSEYFLSK
jgi:exonuclease VII large subunit